MIVDSRSGGVCFCPTVWLVPHRAGDQGLRDFASDLTPILIQPQRESEVDLDLLPIFGPLGWSSLGLIRSWRLNHRWRNHQLDWALVADRAVRALLVVVPTPILHL
jgi:hypothetical protein